MNKIKEQKKAHPKDGLFLSKSKTNYSCEATVEKAPPITSFSA